MPHQCTNCGRSFQDGSKEMLSGCPDCGGNKFQFKPAGAAGGDAGGAGAATSAATAPKKRPETTEPAVDDAPETGGDDRGGAVNRAAATVRDWVRTRNDADAGDDAEASDARNTGSSGRTPWPGEHDDSDADDATATGSTRTGGPSADSVTRDSTGNAAPSAGDTASTAGNAAPSNGNAAPSTEDTAPSTEDTAQASARRDVVSRSELPDEPASTGPTAAPESDRGDANVVDTPDDTSPGLKELREELNSQFESIRIVEPGQYELNLMELYEREEYIISLKEDGKYVIEVPDAWDAADR
ncbi:OapC/ArvC family zinc-ribbon domain-containing protein [Halorussus sp. AFM4]|uniref:Zn-ribbon domain-containing protein n=1 Tax=Halorussus sp. AFM4 TaxID=3421651 RepID=UPI003EB6B5E3